MNSLGFSLILLSASLCGTAGAQNQALFLDGEGDEVLVPYTSSIDLTQTFTIEAWVRHATPLDTGLFAKYGPVVSRKSSINAPWNASYEMGSVLVAWSTFSAHRNGQGGNCFYGSKIVEDSWTHWAWVHTPQEDALYRGGLLDAVADLPDPVSSTMPLHIGHRVGHTGSPEEWFHGAIDDLRIWNVARTPAMLRQTINFSIESEDVALYPDLVASWTFEGNASDATGANDGMLVEDAAFVPAVNIPFLVFRPWKGVFTHAPTPVRR